MDQDRFKKILDAFLGDDELSAQVNTAPTFEAGYELVAKKLPDLTLAEFTEAMNLLRDIMMANATQNSNS